jgi:acetyltransferase
VRLILEPDLVRGEYAVLVRSDLKGKGLGWALMQHLIAYAKSEGVQEIYGSVLAENTTMLEMVRELGFAIETAQDDATLRNVHLNLAKNPVKASTASPREALS